MTAVPETVLIQAEHEAKEVDRSSSCDTTKELFRRDHSPAKDETPAPETPKSPNTRPVSKIPSKPILKTMMISNRESATRKKSNSGIPLRMKSGVAKTTKGGTYRHTPPAPVGTVINKNTLEVQFMNNKKRLLQLHAELVDKQRPLMDMHKSLLRTKKQLEELGKKVVLEDLKIVSLKADDAKNQLDGAGENPAAETAMNLKNSIENVLDACVKVCRKCLVKRENVVRMLESASKSAIEPADLEAEVEDLKKEKCELEQTVENVLKESEKKIESVINNWQKSVKMKYMSEEVSTKIGELENIIKQQQKALQEAEDSAHSFSRKFEDRKATYEKSLNDMQEKYNKLEEELKKEKKNTNDNLMKSRNLRSKVTELEAKTKEAEEKGNESTNKLKQLQDQLRRKEIQWMKEKDELKKNEALLQQKFAEKQSQFDKRLQDIEEKQKKARSEQEDLCRNLETQLEIKDQEFNLLEKEKDALAETSRALEGQVQELKQRLDTKEKQMEELKVKTETLPAIEYKPSESYWIELMEYKQKVATLQNTTDKLNDELDEKQTMLAKYAHIMTTLKVEKDNATKYANKLREVLQEARDELEAKNKAIYGVHEKLVLKDREYEKLKNQLKAYESYSEYSGEKWSRNRCQICMSNLGDERMENSSCADTEVGKSSVSTPQYVSESLIGMSVKKVDHLRARLDNLKKMKLPGNTGKKHLNVKHSWSHPPVSDHWRKQIELRGKLYQILQKHADQSCEDFINLLKLTVSSNSGKGMQDELKPSNMKDVDKTASIPKSSKLKITDSFRALYFNAVPISELYDKINESGNSDTDEIFGY